ncbi:unnamed protein product [Owenia fusiformis]|uniref:Sphingomyelin phosphodiesterase n=1 Tax=Owenia fusiformis TaxID=6347 RepID=A0A8S4PH59_OWEFU|nr:unnamed protein product [Owenia fusiformis]
MLFANYVNGVLSESGLLFSTESRDHGTNEWEKSLLVNVAKVIKGLDLGQGKDAISLKKQINRNVIRQTDNDTQLEDPGCDACQIVLELIDEIDDKGLTLNDSWVEVKGTVELLCELVLDMSSLRGSVMCPGLLDNFGTHLMFILRNSSRPRTEMCHILEFCLPPKPADYIPNSPMPVKLPMESNPTRRMGPQRERTRRATKVDDIRIVQIADIHYDNKYEEGSQTDCGLIMCCANDRNYVGGSGNAGKWGDYSCNTPKRTFEYYLQNINNVSNSYDAVIYTGDHPPHAIWEETLELQTGMSREVVDSFKTHLPNATVYFNLGNHEFFPTNQYYLERPEVQQLLESLSSWWSEVSDLDQTQKNNIKNNGHYTTIVAPGLRVISFNTNYGYGMNFYNVLNFNSAAYNDSKMFVENSLEAATVANEKVIMVGHHPPGSVEPTWSKWYNDLMVRYADAVVLQMGGHTHNDHFQLIRDYNTGAPMGVYSIASSMTTNGEVNPSARVYILDGTTLALKDIEQYRFDIRKAQAGNKEPHIELTYKATEYYGMPDLSPSSWMDLTERMLMNETLFRMHYENHWARSGRAGECDDVCKHEYVCNLRHARGDHAFWCKMDYNNQTTAISSTTTVPPTTTTLATTPTNTVAMATSTPTSRGGRRFSSLILFCICVISTISFRL